MNLLTKKEWFTAFELENIVGVPNRATNITRKATNENWEKRQIKGKKGIAFEYHYSSLPIETQYALGFEPMNAVVEQVAAMTSQSTLEMRVKQLEAMINQLVGTMNLNEATQQYEGEVKGREKLLLRYFRQCTEEGKVMLLASAEAMATQAKKSCEEAVEVAEVA